MRDLVYQLVAYTNVLNLLLLQQTVRTAQLRAQIEEDAKILKMSEETIRELTTALLGKTEEYIC